MADTAEQAFFRCADDATTHDFAASENVEIGHHARVVSGGELAGATNLIVTRLRIEAVYVKGNRIAGTHCDVILGRPRVRHRE
jgi:hypothetical protein